MPKNSEKGVTLIITFFILTIILVVVLSLSIILYKEIKIIRNIGNSVVSFYAADSGIEKVLYYDRWKEDPASVKSGICAMCDPESPRCSSDPVFDDQSTACDCGPLVGEDCDPLSCGNCTASFSTQLNDKTDYKVTVNVLTEGGISYLGIDAIGNFKNTKRAVQVVSTETGDLRDLEEFDYRKKITIENNSLAGDSNFPLYVDIIGDSDMAKALANGNDVRFTLADGTTLLKYEEETWFGGGGSEVTAYIWVKLPVLASMDDPPTDIYIYYNYPDASDGQEVPNTWSGDTDQTGIELVWGPEEHIRPPRIPIRTPERWVCGESFTDTRDGKTYTTVSIGSQCWMRENLNVGTLTAGVNNQGTSCDSIQKYCYDDNESNCNTYGGLYQWNQTMCGSTTEGATGICPTGWHVPTSDEYTTLERAVCTSGTCATDFPYDTSTVGFRGTNEGTTLKTINSSSFSGLLAGIRNTNGSFLDVASYTTFWSSSKRAGYGYPLGRSLSADYATILRGQQRNTGSSLRCLYGPPVIIEPPPPPPPWVCGDAITDSRDGKVYRTVSIGSQCWMRENLNVGTLTAGANNQGTSCSSIQKYCYDNNESNCTTYGGLYQWDQAMCGSITAGATGICPTGWHVPTHDEYTTLERAVCTSGSCATDFPYDTTTLYYRGTNEGTTLKTVNSSSFSGILAGWCDADDGLFYMLNSYAYFWSSVQSYGYGWLRHLNSGDATVYRNYENKTRGNSVRCLKD